MCAAGSAGAPPAEGSRQVTTSTTEDATPNGSGGRPPVPGHEYVPDRAAGAAGAGAIATPGPATEERPEPAVPEPEPPVEPAAALRCALIGPGDAGKTHLLDACEQACVDPAAIHALPDLEYLGGAQTARQSERALRGIADSAVRLAPTDDVDAYEAFITATWPATFWRAERRKSLRLRFVDGPGGALFPTDLDRGQERLLQWERQLLAEGQVADALLLCVDATDPQLDRLTQFLPRILSGISFSKPVSAPPPRPGHRLLRLLRLATDPPALALRRVQARRFLLVLTKIDRLASGPSDTPGRERGGSRPAPHAVAANLSPLELACELVDASNLLRILGALTPGAEFAVALTSALGFNTSGFPFMEHHRPTRLSAQPSNRRSADWRPFGIREALLFVLAGKTGGPVELVTRSKLSRPRRHYIDLPSWYFD
jgi:hypothetical protein